MRRKIQKFMTTVMVVVVVILLFIIVRLIDDETKQKIAEVDEQTVLESEKQIRKIDTSEGNIIDGSLYIEIDACFKYILNLESYVEQSTNIIQGQIIDLSFVEVEQIPWTKISIKIDESIMGELQKDEIITIYELGGYITGESFIKMFGECNDNKISNEDLVEMKYFQKNMHSIGEKGIFCVKSWQETSIFSSDTYELVGSSYSVFIYNEEEDAYLVRDYEKQEEDYITLDEFKHEIADCIEK